MKLTDIKPLIVSAVVPPSPDVFCPTAVPGGARVRCSTTPAQLSPLFGKPLIRRRGSAILKRLEKTPGTDWKSATIDIPKRRNRRIHYLDEPIQLDDCKNELRQIAVTGLGLEQPTLFLTNHPDASPRELITH